MTPKSIIIRGLAVAVALAGTLVMPQASSADVPCSTRSTKAHFSQWGDNNQYFVAPGGTFEANAGTTFSGGAKRVSGNEPWKINGSTHASAAQLPAGGSIKIEKFCVNSDEDSLRFFYRKPNVAGATLHITVRVTSGVNVATNDMDYDGAGSGWVVSPRMMLPDIRDASGRQWVEITYTTRNTGATWLVDDVMIDPWKTR